MDSIMTLRTSNQVLCNVLSYDFYDMALSTEQQLRHMINIYLVWTWRDRSKMHLSILKLILKTLLLHWRYW